MLGVPYPIVSGAAAGSSDPAAARSGKEDGGPAGAGAHSDSTFDGSFA